MAKFRILWDNEWDGGTLTPTTEAADYPVENTQHIWRSRVWRTTSAAAQEVECDCGAAVDVSYVVIENHNIPVGSTVEMIGADAPAGADVTITFAAVTPTRMVAVLGTVYSHRYWRLEIDDPAAGPGDYFEIGRVYIGEYFEFAHHYRHMRRTFVDPSQRIASDAGQVASNQLDRYQTFSFEWSLGAVSDAELETLFEIFETVGGAVPYWIDYDTTKTLPGAVRYVLNARDWNFDPLVFERWGFSIDVEEAR